MNNARIATVNWQDYHHPIQAIRRHVFIEEQHVPESDEWDGLDASAHHYLVFAANADEPIATARLLPTGRLTRMAVLPQWRNQGIGSQLLNHVLDHARGLGLTSVTLHAQVQAANFYRHHDFTRKGDNFFEAGIEHVAMQRLLDLTSVQRIEYNAQALQYLRDFSCSARRSLDIFSQTLPAGLYGDTELADNISSLARRTPNSVVRLLIRDTGALHSGSQPLVQLARRLPSRVEIREYTEGAANPDHSFFCVDRCALVAFSDENVPAGFACKQARAESRKLLEELDYLWSHGSRSDPNLRLLHL